jgi:hypothetical protein
MSIVHVSLSMVKSLNRPVYSFFSRQTRISDWRGRFRVVLVLRPFLIVKAFCTWRSAYKRRTFFVILRIASARYIIKGNGAKPSVILGYAPNTNNVNIISSGPAESLIVLIAICNTVFALIPFWNLSRMIS